MELSLQNKIAFVSGSSRGIGFAIAKELALHGARVILASRNKENLEKAQAEIEAAGGTAFFEVVHFGKPEQIQACVERVLQQHSKIDILVNNFGFNPVHTPLEEITLDHWQKMLDYNLTQYFFTSKLVIPSMKKQNYGKIINISSHSSTKVFPNFGAYGINKAGIDMLTKVLAAELADHNINVNGIAPGYVETDFNQHREDVKDKKNLASVIPLHHIGVPQDIAPLAAFLASDISRYITAEVVIADGGYSRIHQ